MTTIAGILHIDCGAGREDPDTGGIRYWQPPRAQYDCLLCHTTEGPVAGSVKVREFIESARREHATRCRANQARAA